MIKEQKTGQMLLFNYNDRCTLYIYKYINRFISCFLLEVHPSIRKLTPRLVPHTVAPKGVGT